MFGVCCCCCCVAAVYVFRVFCLVVLVCSLCVVVCVWYGGLQWVLCWFCCSRVCCVLLLFGVCVVFVWFVRVVGVCVGICGCAGVVFVVGMQWLCLFCFA